MEEDEYLKEIKKLEKERKSLIQNLEIEQKRVADIKLRISKFKVEVNRIRDKRKPIDVSQHAIVRYFERVLGYDIELVKKEIVPDTVQDSIKILGSKSISYPVNTSHILKIENNVVVSVLPYKQFNNQ